MKQMGTLEAQMKNIKSQLSGITATGNAGAGMVEVTVNGEHKVVSISINDIMLSPENKNMIETDYVAGANIAGFEKVVDAMLAQGVC